MVCQLLFWKIFYKVKTILTQPRPFTLTKPFLPSYFFAEISAAGILSVLSKSGWNKTLNTQKKNFIAWCQKSNRN